MAKEIMDVHKGRLKTTVGLGCRSVVEYLPSNVQTQELMILTATTTTTTKQTENQRNYLSSS